MSQIRLRIRFELQKKSLTQRKTKNLETSTFSIPFNNLLSSLVYYLGVPSKLKSENFADAFWANPSPMLADLLLSKYQLWYEGIFGPEL